VLLSVDYLVADEIIFDDIFEGSVVPEQTQLDDVVAELLPLHALIPVDVDLLEEIYQCQGQFHL
jgi:hypothetical protein